MLLDVPMIKSLFEVVDDADDIDVVAVELFDEDILSGPFFEDVFPWVLVVVVVARPLLLLFA